MKIICTTRLLPEDPPFVGTEVYVRPTAEQLTWGIYNLIYLPGISSLEIDCGDGTTVTVPEGEKFIHTYPRPGRYRVRIPDSIKSFMPSMRNDHEYNELYAPLIESVKINTPNVSIIAAGAFKNCKNMASFDLRACTPSSISIESLRDCHALTSLDGLPQTIAKIQNLSFCSCRNVQGCVKFPRVSEIVPTTPENAPFLDCPKITELHFPASAVESITSHPLYPISFGAENAAVFCDL